jgi:hypothetical protein
MQRGFVCGVEWPVFRRTVDKYRKQIEKTHGGKSGVREQLVFAHNDVSLFEVVSPKTDTNVHSDPVWQPITTPASRRVSTSSPCK